MKRCYKCKEEKPRDFFKKDSSKKDGLNSMCKPCIKEYRTKYYSTPEGKTAVRRVKLVKKYGLTTEQYNGMVEAQNGLCAICFQAPETILYVDHCHTTGKIRGLLCAPCNFGLGHFKDSQGSLQSALDYLRSSW